MQPKTLLMIRPENFRETINQKAQEEFDLLVKKITEEQIEVIVIKDTKEPKTPNAIFLTNWVSFHKNKEIVLYPLSEKQRRLERREDILEVLDEKSFDIEGYIDLTPFEDDDVFLEGTGSIVLDRKNQKAYCALSEIADEELFIEFCEIMEYFPVVFSATQNTKGKTEEILYTNSILSITEKFAIICLDVIEKKEKKDIVKHLKSSGKEIIQISEEQVNSFAGNILEVKNKNNESFLIMSTSAYNSLIKKQIIEIEKHYKIIHSDITIIENHSNKSIKSMIVEIFLPKKQNI